MRNKNFQFKNLVSKSYKNPISRDETDLQVDIDPNC